MDCNIILNALRESIDYIKKLDQIRGELVKLSDESEKYNFLPENTFKYLDFERDYRDADGFLNNKYLSLKIFESGFSEFMSSEITAKYEKTYLMSQILKISKTCNNLVWYGDLEYDIFTYDCYDKNTDFEEDYRTLNGETYWFVPDLEGYKNAYPDHRELNIYYNYSYYLISIAKKISDAVNNYLKLNRSRYLYYNLSKKKTKFHKMSLKHFNPIEAMYISDIFNEYQDYIRNGNESNERSYSFGGFFLDYLNFIYAEDKNAEDENVEDKLNFEEILANKTFKDSQSEEYYNKILKIFELEKVFKDDDEKKNYYNLLEYKFKVYDEEDLGVYTLGQAYEICKDLCLILENKNAIKVFESFYPFNTNSQNTLSSIKEDEYDYDELTPILDKYFDNGSRDVYKSIIENHCLISPSSKRLKAYKKVNATCLKSFFKVPTKVLNNVFEFENPLKSGNFPKKGEYPAIYNELEKKFPKVK